MIAADTSSLIAYFSGRDGSDVERIHDALGAGELRISPIAFTELLSDPRTTTELEMVVAEWRQLDITQGYWLRAARTRARLLNLKLKPKLPDTLIAQSAIDYNIPLIARDDGFRHFAKHCGLKLA
ncbi:MAG: PIN domain-containing protein [Alphaproteobacteria bacterium]|nr:PIN domain-containing protein [Alphaproteobacteria bacterium]MBN9559019.1 PIN domain-containing protein [Alphaproteobacteria bacterium]MBN9567332.1 PIN domain-containing protein [Alphaproteobacteria bacterium]MBN9577049.1 PIN domain-containing protein [Alphaproteobacteria bacterium]MBN9590797.1 PIN domain-containing protein [Alphaproteobacteria bacterium]